MSPAATGYGERIGALEIISNTHFLILANSFKINEMYLERLINDKKHCAHIVKDSVVFDYFE